MKLIRINFTPMVSSSSPCISALGGTVPECHVGKRIQHGQWLDEENRLHPLENTVVSSMELDPTRPLVYIRQVYAEGEKKGQPYRRQTSNQQAHPGEIADCIAVPYNDRCVLYFDDDGPDYMGSMAANLHNFRDAPDEPPKRGPGRPRKNPETEPAGE